MFVNRDIHKSLLLEYLYICAFTANKTLKVYNWMAEGSETVKLNWTIDNLEFRLIFGIECAIR